MYHKSTVAICEHSLTHTFSLFAYSLDREEQGRTSSLWVGKEFLQHLAWWCSIMLASLVGEQGVESIRRHFQAEHDLLPQPLASWVTENTAHGCTRAQLIE
jgi:hypothetical protein